MLIGEHYVLHDNDVGHDGDDDDGDDGDDEDGEDGGGGGNWDCKELICISIVRPHAGANYFATHDFSNVMIRGWRSNYNGYDHHRVEDIAGDTDSD